MARQNEIRERDAQIIKFVRAVKETAERMNTNDTTLIAIAFVFGLLWDYMKQQSYTYARDKWNWQEGDQ